MSKLEARRNSVAAIGFPPRLCAVSLQKFCYNRIGMLNPKVFLKNVTYSAPVLGSKMTVLCEAGTF